MRGFVLPYRTSISSEKANAPIKKGGHIFLLLGGLFGLGMLYGVLLVRTGSGDIENGIASLLSAYVHQIRVQTPFGYFKDSVYLSIFTLIVPYLSGFSAIGHPMALAAPLARGLTLGFFMSSLYMQFGFQGVLYSLFVLVPNALLCIFCLLIGCRESIRLSNLFFGSFAFRHSTGVTLSAIKVYHVKMGVLLLISLGGSLLDLICFLLFGGLLPI